MDKLPKDILDYRLETRAGSNRRQVTQLVHDASLPPSSPPRLELWEREKRPVGRGGQAPVYVQKCTAEGREQERRAVKYIPYHDTTGRQRYLQELATMVEFSHERVRPASSSHQSRDLTTYFLVLETICSHARLVFFGQVHLHCHGISTWGRSLYLST